MKETLLFLYSVSTTIFAISIFMLPIALYWLVSKKCSKATGVVGISILTSLFALMSFIPLVIPENHKYFIFPSLLYVGVCFAALLIKLFSPTIALPPGESGG